MSTATKTKTKSIYELTGDYEQIVDLLEFADDEQVAEMLRDTLEAIEGSIEQKLEALVKVRRNYEAEAEMFKIEKQRLEKKQQAAERQVQRITTYIEDALTRLGFDHKNKKRVSAGLFKIGFNKIAPSLRIVDVNKVPEKFKIIPEPVVDKRGLLAHAKEIAGDLTDRDEIELANLGVIIENGKQTLSIK